MYRFATEGKRVERREGYRYTCPEFLVWDITKNIMSPLSKPAQQNQRQMQGDNEKLMLDQTRVSKLTQPKRPSTSSIRTLVEYNTLFWENMLQIGIKNPGIAPNMTSPGVNAMINKNKINFTPSFRSQFLLTISSNLNSMKNPKMNAESTQNRRPKLRQIGVKPTMSKVQSGILAIQQKIRVYPVRWGILCSQIWLLLHLLSQEKQNQCEHTHLTCSHPFVFSIMLRQLGQNLCPAGRTICCFDRQSSHSSDCGLAEHIEHPLLNYLQFDRQLQSWARDSLSRL